MIIGFAALIFVMLLVIGVHITNPFSRLTIIRQPFAVVVMQSAFVAEDKTRRIAVRQAWWWKSFAVLKSFVHILETRYINSPRSTARTTDGIIADIHAHRFNPRKLLLTSGDHFSALFVRNLGVFYYPMLDTRVVGSAEDWHNRQIVYMQTLAYALGVFAKRPIPVTTIMPVGAYRATCVNYYVYPSDTVYGILYALAALLGDEPAAPYDYAPETHQLGTKPLAEALRAEYRGTLSKLYADYRRTVFDEQTGLIRAGIHLSGAKDITRRVCAFYDNVIFWKTAQLAGRLGIIPEDKAFLAKLKRTILRTFWLEDAGYFLEDLSGEGRARAYYSSDWLIVLATGFLDPRKANERKYFTRSVAYIQAQGIDQPFAIKYQHETRAHRQFFLARLAFAAYGGDVVWSFWGMEYIKVLLMLYEATSEQSYLKAADFHLNAYERAMLRDGGFPEVYNKQGKLYQTPIYRSIRQTGWVIGFEQARAMRAAIAGKRGRA